MEVEKNIQDILERVPQPGFLVKNNTIVSTNQAASALLLSPGDSLDPMLESAAEEYASFYSGQLFLTLSVGGQPRNAVVTRSKDQDLFLLDPEEESDEFRSLGLVSMELRGPLTRLMSSAESLLESQGLTGDNATPEAANMNRNLMQLMRLVCNMSDVSRYAVSSHMELRDVDSFLASLFEKAGTLTASRNIQLTYTGLATSVFSLIDSEQLERAVWNMISNAVKFTPRGGTIQATLTRQGNRLRLQILDSGSGIAETVRGDLFRRYLRQPGIEDSRFGLGLGMTLLRTAAATHGGTILIDQPECAGTRVTMTLAIRQNKDTLLRSPILLPDYSGGWDHGLLELSDCLPEDLYRNL